MKARYVVRLSIEDIMCQKSRFFLSVLLIGLSLFFIGYFQVFSFKSKVVKEECNELLTRGIDGTGLMRVVRDYDTYEAEELKRAALESGMVKGIGTWNSWADAGMLPELTQLQLSFPDVIPHTRTLLGPGNDYLHFCTIDRMAMDIYDFRFSEKEEVTEEKWKTPNWHGIYLGANFKGIPVGTVYREEQSDGEIQEYEVIGIMEKGQCMVSVEIMTFGKGNGVLSILQMDSLVIIVMEQGVSQIDRNSAWAYIPGDNVTLEEAQKYLKEKAKELGVGVEFGYLRDGFYADRIMMRDFSEVDEEIGNTLFWVCLLINCCIMVMLVTGSRKKLGIYYACGFSLRDILGIYLCQTILRVLVPLGLALLALERFCRQKYAEYQPFQVSVFRWLKKFAYPQMLLFAMILFVIFAMIPVYMVWRSKPADLIKDFRG